MASESLIRQAEKMYQSELDTTDYAKLLTQPAVDVMSKNLEEQKLKTEELIATMPAGVNISKVPEELRGIVTNYLTENKTAYVDAAKVVASGIKPTDQRYIDAIETMNRIRGGFEALDASLVNIAEKRKLALESRDNISPGAHGLDSILHEKWANGEILKEFTLEDGNFYFKTTDREGKEIKVNANDYAGAMQQSSVLTEGMITLNDHSRKLSKEGYSFEELKGDYTGRINTMLNNVGRDGRVDFAYNGVYGIADTPFIDTYIKDIHGVTRESNPEEFETHYQKYKNESFKIGTEMGKKLREYLLGTLENSYRSGSRVSRAARTPTTPTTTPTTSGRFADGESIRAEGLGVWVPYSTAKKMHDQIVLANDGKAAAFTLNKGKYTYDPKTKNWSGTKDGETVNYGSSDKLRQSLGINDSTFTALTAAVDTDDSLADKGLLAKLSITKSDQSWKTTTKKYGGGMYGPRSGTQNIQMGSVMYVLEAYENIKTVRDLENILGRVISDDSFRSELMDFINNKENHLNPPKKDYNINDKFLDDMIKDVINAIKKSGYTEPTATATATAIDEDEI